MAHREDFFEIGTPKDEANLEDLLAEKNKHVNKQTGEIKTDDQK